MLLKRNLRTKKKVSREWWLCAKFDSRGNIIMKQYRVKRVCAEICEACSKNRRCDIWASKVPSSL
jgi:hypothetical protein